MMTFGVTVEATIEAGKLSINPLVVCGNLDLSDQCVTLPPKFTVRGDLILRRTRIGQLPELLTVEGDLDLSDCPAWFLGNGTTVGGDLFLGPGISTLPKKLTVKGDLHVGQSRIRKIDESVTVLGKVWGLDP
jgi:hypothetical protein